MNIGVAYVTPIHKVWIRMEMPDDCSAEEAITRSGILTQFPEIDLSAQKVGIFGRIVKLTQRLEDGDRVEIYRPITVDPDQVERRDM
ncbi:RnfH family protein [Cohaesibacter sp. CAU 1516]|uniref:RnfH family protein n=1 Tax=Cohaesibacter sp. CAU 1516 TaxID=2576038 RepID=UPI0010FF055C|nr:RnfH family protein [Cohaesibacter sp. CAU 1516]TLP44274.1 RnfH family protein [Cohaesibacter sp. CAU 1516]